VSVVVDANLVTALLVPLPYRPQAMAKRAAWSEAQETLVAPMLVEYEVCSALWRLATAGWFPVEALPGLLVEMRRLDIQMAPPTVALHQAAFKWAQQLGRSKTYDAQYMALAEELRADLWTSDLRLFNRAKQLGLSWVNCIQEPSSQPS